MEIWPILGITSAVYLLGTWLIVWVGSLLFDRTPPAIHRSARTQDTPLPVLLLLEDMEEQLEYAIRHTLWTSTVKGIPLRVYLPQQETVHPILLLIRRNWPDLQLEHTDLQPDAFPPGTWLFDVRHA